MGLTLRKTSDWWYARYYIDGRQIVKRLTVKVKGQRPARLAEEGDRVFENSRIRAEEAFDSLRARLDTNKSEEELAQAVYQARAGKKLKRYRLEDMAKIWIEKPRKRPPSFEHHQQCVSKLNKLTRFLNENYPKLTRIDQIRDQHIRAFLDTLEAEGVTGETWNKYLVTIKAVLKRSGVPAAAEIIAKETETIFREPYSIEELGAILDAAKCDRLIYSLAVTAATTAMRRKDCCFLTWESVDFEENFITVKTSKTGVTVDIPMADLLIEVVKAQKGNKSEYIFPEAKELYEADPTAITRRFKNVLRLAGFGSNPVEYRTDKYTKKELEEKAREMFTGGKLENVLNVVSAYVDGQSMTASAQSAGVSQGTASLYLNDLESATGKAIIRGKARVVQSIAKTGRGDIRKERKNGKLAASVRDFHSFRTTWVTLALMNGMPIETVRKVTGHQTASIVTKHYFKPHRAELKKVMQKTMPGLLTSSAKSINPSDQALELLNEINRRMSKADILQQVDKAVQLMGSA